MDLFQSKPLLLQKNYTPEILSVDQMVADIDEQFTLKSLFFVQTVKNSPIILIGDSFSTNLKNNLDLIGFGRFNYLTTYSLRYEYSLKPFKNAIIIWVFSEE